MHALTVLLLLSGMVTGFSADRPSDNDLVSPEEESDIMSDLQSLQPLAFRPLPLGEIRPEGWLKRQLEIQAAGLSGHLDEVWPDIRDSQWFGGHGRDGWERAPYWLDGVIPLAFLLDDAALKEKVTGYVNYVLDHQEDDGWLGPRDPGTTNAEVREKYDLWAIFLALKVLVEYHGATGDPRVEPAVYKSLRGVAEYMDRSPLYNWGRFRAFEALIAMEWLYERRFEAWLLKLADTIEAQGFDWAVFFKDWQRTEPTEKGKWNYEGHVVNNAMALKAPALWWRLTGDPAAHGAVLDMIGKLDRYHGMATGVFTGDECLAGKNPTQGTELCAVVEYMWSLEVLTAIFGDAAFGDRLEKIAFNALPATFSPDMWAHQYDQQANQVECSINEDRGWNTNGADANLFGLEPNFGCCTANLSQGWPKFAAHLWMTTPEGGLAAVAYAPSRVDTEIGGVRVVVTLDTDYPFRDALRFTVETAAPVRFPLLLRIPAWSEDASVRVDGASAVPCQAGGFHRIDREWEGTATVELTLPMHVRGERRYHDAITLERGPLVYALRIGESWRRVHADMPNRELPHGDWEVYATTPWNYALAVDEQTLDETVVFEEGPVGDRPFSPEGAPVTAKVKGRQLPAWGLVNGSAGELPPSPVVTDTPLKTLTLIPYGCTNLRVTEFPTVSLD